MKTAPIRVFDRVGFISSAEAGESANVSLFGGGIAGSGIYFFYKGRREFVYSDSGDTLPLREAPWLSSENAQLDHRDGDGKAIFTEDSKWVCIPRGKNSNVDMQMANLAEGESRAFAQDDRLFVVEGSISAGDVQVTGPKAVKFSRPTLVTAITPVSALQFL